MSAKRYDSRERWEDGTDGPLMTEHSLGDYVLHSDYAALEIENAQLKLDNEELKKKLDKTVELNSLDVFY